MAWLHVAARGCAQFGRLSDVGVYAGFTNHYAIGAFMEKGMRMRAGQARTLAPTAPCTAEPGVCTSHAPHSRGTDSG